MMLVALRVNASTNYIRQPLEFQNYTLNARPRPSAIFSQARAWHQDVREYLWVLWRSLPLAS